MNRTINYYDDNAYEFADKTQSVDFRSTQNRFLSKLPLGGQILDFGCGAGRDSQYFLQSGFRVDATDGSAKMCEIASEFCKIPVRHMMFQDLDETEKYDGIWACSSILHLNKKELGEVLRKMVKALKPEGIIYTSFKYGTFEGLRNDRFFTDFTEESFREWISNIKGIAIEECWISSDVRPGRGKEKWLNLILGKK